jgi:site-specific recombinase
MIRKGINPIMKKLTLLILSVFLFAVAKAQPNADSLAYELQRKKINNMLSVREQKFGQYDVSLTQRTGIFGLQTKKDIRRSNEILMDIVHTDNELYKQIKILLDHRTFQQTEAIDKSKESEKAALGLMYTVNRLKDQIEKLKKEADEQAQQQKNSSRNYIIIIALLSVVSILLIWRQVKTQNTTL